MAVNGKNFNHSARDAWELFQSTGVEALIAYDCSGAVLLMGTICGGLITGTCSGVWAWFKWRGRVLMIGSTSMLMGMVLVRQSSWWKFFCSWGFFHTSHNWLVVLLVFNFLSYISIVAVMLTDMLAHMKVNAFVLYGCFFINTFCACCLILKFITAQSLKSHHSWSWHLGIDYRRHALFV